VKGGGEDKIARESCLVCPISCGLVHLLWCSTWAACRTACWLRTLHAKRIYPPKPSVRRSHTTPKVVHSTRSQRPHSRESESFIAGKSWGALRGIATEVEGCCCRCGGSCDGACTGMPQLSIHRKAKAASGRWLVCQPENEPPPSRFVLGCSRPASVWLYQVLLYGWQRKNEAGGGPAAPRPPPPHSKGIDCCGIVLAPGCVAAGRGGFLGETTARLGV